MCLIYGEDDKLLIFRFLYGLFVVLYKSSSIFIIGNRFSPILLLFYRRFHVFLTIAIYIYLCFTEKVVFRFLAFGFSNHTTRIYWYCRKKLYVKQFFVVIFLEWISKSRDAMYDRENHFFFNLKSCLKNVLKMF